MAVLVSRPEGEIEQVFAPSQDAYLEEGQGMNNELLRVEDIARIRRSYLQFDLSELNEVPVAALLRLTGAPVEDGGHLTLNLYAAASSAWTEQDLHAENAPEKGEFLGTVTGDAHEGVVVEFDLGAHIAGPGVYSFVLETPAGDFAFASKESAVAESHPLLQLTIATNAPPVAAGMTAVTVEDRPLLVPFADLLAGSSDPDGDPVSVVAVGGTTAEGGEFIVSDEGLVYTPSIDFLGEDRFEFIVQDGRGGFAAAELVIQVFEGDGIGEQRLSIEPGEGEGSGPVLRFSGVPLLLYAVERSPDLKTWETLTTIRAAEDGQLSWADPAPPERHAFYRLSVP
jgi:hypothetical protein